MKLKMELLSDLCASSGDSLSPMVDIDVVVDEYGIPYIPSKRVKGVLREAGETLCKLGYYDFEELDNIFGKPGQLSGGSLRIDNGRIEKYECIKDYIDSCYSNQKSDMKSFLGKDYIIDYFTVLRDQTSIDDKTYMAKDKSLRKVRAIKKGNAFYFPLEISNKHRKLFEDCCKLTRNIGLNRTRGFGEVKLTLVNDDVFYENLIDREKFLDKYSQEYKGIQYKIKLIDNVIISGRDGNISIAHDYIPGINILGYFASRYIRKNNVKNNAHKDSAFRRLFLEDHVIFDNAYISYNDKQYRPCPASIFKEKDKDNYFNLFVYGTEMRHEKLNNKYILFKNSNRIEFKEPLLQEYYHHKRANDKSIGHANRSEDENKNCGEFYQYEGLKKGQEFIGYIYGDIEDVKEIIDLIPENGEITIGRSKNAQYSKSQIEFIEYKNNNQDNYIDLERNIQIVLESPCILKNKNGFNTVNSSELENKIREKLRKIGLDNAKLELEDAFVNTTTISGFNAKWLLPKEQNLAFDKGTTLYFKYNSELQIDKAQIDSIRIGEKINEGYGKIYSIINPCKSLIVEGPKKASSDLREMPDALKDMLYYIQKKIFIDQLTLKAIVEAEKKEKNMINPTTIGKMNRMLYDSINTREPKTKTIEDLERKINVVKDKKRKSLGIESKEEIQRQFKQTEIWQNYKKRLVPRLVEEINEQYDDFYVEYLSSYLKQLKYGLRRDKR